MTVTTPSTPVRSAGSPVQAWNELFAAVDHLRLGLISLGAAFTFLLLAALTDAGALRVALLVGGGFWMGLFTATVPAAVGSDRLAFPRLHALGTWLYIFGGVVAVATDAPEEQVIGSLVVAVGLSLIAGDLLVTAVAYRLPDLRFRDFDLYPFGAVVTCAFSLFTLAGVVAGNLIIFLVLHYSNSEKQVAAWNLGQQLVAPVGVQLLLLPAIAVGLALVGRNASKGLVGRRAARVLLVMQAAVFLGPWAVVREGQGFTTARYWIIPQVAMVPALLLSLLCVMSLLRGKPKLGIDLLAVVISGALVAAMLVRVFSHTVTEIASRDSTLFALSALIGLGALWHFAALLFRVPMGLSLPALGLVAVAAGLAVWSGEMVRGLGEFPFGVESGELTSERAGAVIASVGGVLFLLDLLIAPFRQGRLPVVGEKS